MKRCAIAGVVASGLALGLAAAGCFGDGDGSELPEGGMGFARVREAWCPSDIRVLGRSGEALHVTRTDDSVRRLAWTGLDAVSPALVDAVLVSEDRRFRSHAGVDWRAALAAAWQVASGGPRRGASTITMQVAAMLDPSLRRDAGGRGLARKIAQMRAARSLERRWSKDEILEAYLNLVTFRGEVVGVRAAADAIFAKEPHGLSLAEAAALAASIRSPNQSEQNLLGRARALLAAMGASSDGLEPAVARVTRPPDERGPGEHLVPHAARSLARDAAPCRDLDSSLDGRIQRAAAASLRRHLIELSDRSAADGAVLVVDNASGEALAYVGSSGDLSRAADVDGVRARRQAGSTLKPFVYASAIERGLLAPATLLEDEPLEIAVGESLYRPENYDHRFRGLVSVRTALAASLNVPAVRALQLVGEEALVDTLRDLGVTGLTESGGWYGPSLALGSADVSLWELVAAYRALARGGLAGGISLQTRPAVSSGDERVFDASTAWLVADILADRASRATTFELQSPLATRYWSAVKTGTSKDMRDNWCVGFSRRFTVGVWVGNFGGEPMRDVSGVTGAAPVWRDVMDLLHDGIDQEAAGAPPSGVVRKHTRFANQAEPPRFEVYRRGTEPLDDATALDATVSIASPADGSVLALDPDIAPSRQRVPFVARGSFERLRWELDGRDLGDANAPLLWAPTPARHELALLDADGRRVDSVRFEVRAAAVSARTGHANAVVERRQ